jgi:hypothetical protein
MTRHSMDYSCTSPPVRYTVGTAVGDRNTAELSGRDTASIVRRDSSLCEYGLHSTAPRRPGCRAGGGESGAVRPALQTRLQVLVYMSMYVFSELTSISGQDTQS